MTDGPYGVYEYDDLNYEQREAMSTNILHIENLLEGLVAATTEHLGYTNDNCIRSCVGKPAIELLNSLDERLLHMTLTLAVRHLAEVRFYAQQLKSEGGP